MHVVRGKCEKIVLTACLSFALVFVAFNGLVIHFRNHIDATNVAIGRLKMQLSAQKEEVEITRTTSRSMSMTLRNPNNNNNDNKSSNKKNIIIDNKDPKNSKSFEYIDLKTSQLRTTSQTKSLKILILTFGSAVELPPEAMNQNNDVIYWHEPMKMWERIDAHWRGSDLNVFDGDLIQTTILHNNNHKQHTYKNATQFYNEIISCKFTYNIVYFLSEVVKTCPHFLRESKTLSSILSCNDTFCNKPDEHTVASLNKLCREKRYNVIVRENEERTVPLQMFFSKLSNSITRSLKVLHLVRDPRAVFYEFANSGRIPKNAFMEELWKKGEFVCDKLYQNVVFAKTTPKNYFLFRYEDFMGNEDVIKRIFNYELKNKDGSQSKLTPWWRLEISQALSSQVENLCWKSFEELGYEFLDDEVRKGPSFKRLQKLP